MEIQHIASSPRRDVYFGRRRGEGCYRDVTVDVRGGCGGGAAAADHLVRIVYPPPPVQAQWGCQPVQCSIYVFSALKSICGILNLSPPPPLTLLAAGET